jgi:predicted alpha/beta superfamily hydrolase
MKRVSRVALLVCCVLSCAASVAFAESTDGIVIGTCEVIESRVLKERRTVYISLPESYAQSQGYRRYPVLYLRDGGKFFQSFAGCRSSTRSSTPLRIGSIAATRSRG